MDIAIQIIHSPQALAPLEKILQCSSEGRPSNLAIEVTDENSQSARFEIPVLPAPTLLIAGAGHVGAALAEVASRLDFLVTVIDDRPDYASASRFPSARCIAGDIEKELRRFPITDQTYIVIVTRGHKHDGQALAAVVNSRAAYIGLIGSRRKVHTIFTDLHAQGVPLEKLARIHAPIGLEIAAVTPHEIAVSIAAELVAIRRGHGDNPAAPMKIPAAKLEQWLARDIAAPLKDRP
jgi:xanthine dehydrogenase accessory factor